MKTTVELPDELAARARAHAAKHGTTLRAILEQGVRQVLNGSRDFSRSPELPARNPLLR